ncbi:hypothetical protein OG21DRAFT_848939 [Imleria badia]|nr:hypothetical protein OG21DRAFT_848939 [Imleria badia]
MWRKFERKRGVAGAPPPPLSSAAPAPAFSLNWTPCRQSWTDASTLESDSDSDTFSETSTLVECDEGAHVMRITTVFQEPDPVLRGAVYREYLACSSPEEEETDKQELDLDDMAWGWVSSRHKTAPQASRERRTGPDYLIRLVQKLRSRSTA